MNTTRLTQKILLHGTLLMLSLGSPVMAQADPVDDKIRHYMAASSIPGVAVAVIRDGRVEVSRGYGVANLEWGTPAAPDTAFQLASATKVFTAVALLRLVEEGSLGLDDPVSRFLPDAPEAWSRITVRHLADHTSGLSDELPSHDGSMAGLVAAAMATPLLFEPGAQARYGFTDGVVLRAVMEAAADMPFERIIEDRLVLPLKLKDTRFDHAWQGGPIRSSSVTPRRAATYAWQDGEQRNSDFLYGEVGYAAGGLYSSARDLAALFVALDNGTLLSPGSLEALQTPSRLADGRLGEFAIGWTAKRYRGTPVAGHSGGPALADVLRASDHGLTVVVLTNQQRLYPLLAESVADLYLPAAPERQALSDAHPLITENMEGLMKEAASGAVDPGRLSEQGQRALAPMLQDLGPVLFGMVGPLVGSALIEDAASGSGRLRRYLVSFQNKEMLWQVRTDAQGRVEELRPVSEAF